MSLTWSHPKHFMPMSESATYELLFYFYFFIVSCYAFIFQTEVCVFEVWDIPWQGSSSLLKQKCQPKGQSLAMWSTKLTPRNVMACSVASAMLFQWFQCHGSSVSEVPIKPIKWFHTWKSLLLFFKIFWLPVWGWTYLFNVTFMFCNSVD